MKTFNTAGPCIPSDHYMVSTVNHLEIFNKLIDNKRYFILHAPRQTGKTTLMLQLMEHLNEEGKYIALYVNIETAQPWRNKIAEVNKTIVNEFKIKARIYLPKQFQPAPECFQDSADGFSNFLTLWCLHLPKPLVILKQVDRLLPIQQ